MNRTNLLTQCFTRLRSARFSALFAVIGLIVVASLTVAVIAGASGYNVSAPVKEFFGVQAARARAALQPSSAHNSTLNRPRVSYQNNGRIVVSMEVQGDIRGDLTFILDTSADGSVRSGVWSLVSSYVESIPAPPGGGADGGGGEIFVANGTLTGKTVSASVSFNADGSVASMSVAQLSVDGGSLTFSNISQGSGFATASNLSDRDVAVGSLQLSF